MLLFLLFPFKLLQIFLIFISLGYAWFFLNFGLKTNLTAIYPDNAMMHTGKIWLQAISKSIHRGKYI